ncbi:MAG: response regulator transcription factor [Acidaminococcaceae bacterium]|nr:response regulator transcription factor [Acidaminococcaceae bacterium]MBR1392112.1 response regulator transcription factor [Lachnospiraceae bacterium]MBR1590557.1 response regulator transcription factor [Acidaminococcaceae bacterium]
MYKILIADDEVSIREILRVYFAKEDFQVIEAEDGQQALSKVEKESPDIVILDIMMPVLDGITACEQIRRRFDIPIIMLTAKDEDDDRILGLEKGADDYITKPFNPREVVARVKAVLRRSGGFQKLSDKWKINYPGLSIDRERMEVIAGDKTVTFTTKEFELLYYLASSPGKVYSRNQLLESIWGYTYFGDTRTVDTHIKRIRQKLAIPRDSVWDIETVWGVGYKFELKNK